jgi:hypothetical protein
VPGWEQLAIIAFWGVMGGLIAYIVPGVSGGKRVQSLAFLVFVGGFLLRVVAILVNEEMQFFEAKLAGDYSIGLYEKYILESNDYWGLLKEQFAVQVIINIPVWLMFGAERLSLLVSNAMLGAVVASVAGGLLCKPFGVNVGVRAIVLLAIYPAIFNFSLFGLRDPIIFFSMTVAACGILRQWKDGLSIFDMGVTAFGMLVSFSIRPEMSYVFIIMAGVPFIAIFLNMWASWRYGQRNAANFFLLCIIAITLSMIAAAAATQIASRNIGADTANPFEVADGLAKERYSRHAEKEGSGSHIIPTETYINLPVYLRVPIQTVGMIVIPFPWQATSPARLFAFIDSLFLMSMIGFILINLLYSHPIRQSGAARMSAVLLFAFAIGILGMGVIVSNSGNGFRMRLSVTPLLIVAAAIMPMVVRFSVFKSRSSQSQSSPSQSLQSHAKVSYRKLKGTVASSGEGS